MRTQTRKSRHEPFSLYSDGNPDSQNWKHNHYINEPEDGLCVLVPKPKLAIFYCRLRPLSSKSFHYQTFRHSIVLKIAQTSRFLVIIETACFACPENPHPTPASRDKVNLWIRDSKLWLFFRVFWLKDFLLNNITRSPKHVKLPIASGQTPIWEISPHANLSKHNPTQPV